MSSIDGVWAFLFKALKHASIHTATTYSPLHPFHTSLIPSFCIYLSAASSGLCPFFSTCSLFSCAGAFGSCLNACCVLVSSSCCPVPEPVGLLTGVCTLAVSGDDVLSVARLCFTSCCSCDADPGAATFEAVPGDAWPCVDFMSLA